MKTLFERWQNREIGNFGSFQTTILQAYQIADNDNRERLQVAFPYWFTNQNTDTVKVAKRFKIIDPSGITENGHYDTIKEVVSDLQSDKRDLSLQSYMVEDIVDDIEINADTLLEVWNEGERPEDLQMF